MFESFIYEGEIKLNFIPNLVFFFFDGDNEKEVKNLYDKLLNLNPEMEIIGINGIKGNISNHIPYLIKDKKISIFAFNIDKEMFFVKQYEINNIENLSKNFYKDFIFFNDSASIIFFPFRYDINYFLEFIQQDDMHNVYGGVYSDQKNACFYNGKFFNDKLISVFFNQFYIKFSSISIHGWKPIGIEFKVTKADKNVVYEIEGQTAREVIEDYIGKIKQENIDNFLHPFCVYNKNYKSLASIKSINKDGSISFFKYIKEEEKIKITIPSTQKKVMKEIEEKIKNIECNGLFVFSCIGRYAYYGDLIEFEIQKVYEVLNKPFAGFLTFGEIGSSEENKHSILQNQTMTLVFFKVQK